MFSPWTTAAEGGLWVAEVGAGQVVRFDPKGAELAQIKLPVTKPTAVALGGEALRTLFVTSMRFGLNDEELMAEPDAGCIFALEPGVVGMAGALLSGLSARQS